MNISLKTDKINKCPICDTKKIVNYQQVCDECFNKLKDHEYIVSGAGINAGSGSRRQINNLKEKIFKNCKLCDFGECVKIVKDTEKFCLEHRFSEDNCYYDGCDNKAINGLVFCKEHEIYCKYGDCQKRVLRIKEYCLEHENKKDLKCCEFPYCSEDIPKNKEYCKKHIDKKFCDY